MSLPKLYSIVDQTCFAMADNPIGAMCKYTDGLLTAGATLIQLRDKSGDVQRMLACARELRRLSEGRAKLIINDRVDLCLAAGADGVHLGQTDLSPSAARSVFDHAQAKGRRTFWVGLSTHNPEQIREADTMPVDYLAIGPVFATDSKVNPDSVVGLQGVRLARAATSKPLVAIGGINRKNCREVVNAGADSVAVISDLLENPVKAVEDFLRILE